MPRAELKMQAHICDSYRLLGGYGEKWDPAHKKGKPDLICSLPGFGPHFVEVKHRPEIQGTMGVLKNPLEPRQIVEARRLIEAGAKVYAGLVIGGASSASSSTLTYLDPLAEMWHLSEAKWVGYTPKVKYQVLSLLQMENK